jgi:DNA-binding CsgD family transcriptional regulator
LSDAAARTVRDVAQVGAETLHAGLEELRSGRWTEAVVLLEAALPELDEQPDQRAAALDALADARWWLGNAQGAATAREQGFRSRREAGDQAGAVRVAAWLAREYAAGLGNLPVARGWLARAHTLTAGEPDPLALGWVALAEATLAADAQDQVNHAERALTCARATADADLEILALARLGLALVISGEVEAGLSRLDEAMASAAAGEAEGVTTTAQLCCDFVLASELSGDSTRFASWAEAVDRLAASRGGPSPVSFCTTCCAEQSAAHGDFAGAERQLHVAVVELDQTGRKSRCVPPTTKLAELYLRQGRVEEADRTVAEDDDDSSLLLRARIALVREQPTVATTLAQRVVRRMSTRSVLLVPALSVLVDAHVLAGDLVAADEALTRLLEVAAMNADPRAAAQGGLAQGRLALARADEERATAAFEGVLDELRGERCLEGATARLRLAELRSATQPQVARVDAHAALSTFEELGAAHLADAAAALLRALGDHSRVGPKRLDVLSKREREVLRLVAQGLTNAEIAGRLFISTKTAGNHVSAILMKLGLRTRTEAAAYAAVRTAP